MGIRPYAADCGALVLPLASKVKLRTPSNGSEQFLTIAVCSLYCQTNCIKLSQDFAKDFSARLRSVEMTQGGTRPYIADCGVLVLPLASKVKLRAPSKDLYSDFVNISIEIPRQTRDDTCGCPFCHPERAAEKERRRAEWVRAIPQVSHMQSVLYNLLHTAFNAFGSDPSTSSG